MNPEGPAEAGAGQGLSQQRCSDDSERSGMSGPIVRNRTGDAADWTDKAGRAEQRFIRTDGAFAANAASGCCGNAENGSNAASRICMRPAGCDERICGVTEYHQTTADSCRRVQSGTGDAHEAGYGTPRGMQDRLRALISILRLLHCLSGHS